MQETRSRKGKKKGKGGRAKVFLDDWIQKITKDKSHLSYPLAARADEVAPRADEEATRAPEEERGVLDGLEEAPFSNIRGRYFFKKSVDMY